MADWSICADTGGTFTDCLARDPQGRLHRAKVLSSATLRGTVASTSGATITARLIDLPERFLEGCTFRLLRGSEARRIVRHALVPEAGLHQLTLDAPLECEDGAAFEAQSPEEAPVLAARLVTRTPHPDPLPPVRLRLATTRGTNALLEGKVARVALFITRGFADLPEIGTQARPDLFALNIVEPPLLHEAAVEVNERLAADGTVLQPPDLDAVKEAAGKLVAKGITDAAVALLHSYRNSAHEHAVAEALLEAGFERVSCSADLSAGIRILPRAETAIANAALAPVIEGYLNAVRRGAGVENLRRLLVMTSAGGLNAPQTFAPKDSLLSGPAGGVVGSSTCALAAGFNRAIAFDMGGTSTDVSRFDHDYNYVFEHTVGNARLLAPALAIETVAAGGGSICGFRHGQLFVGPESAGASPGPACYGACGPLTITDVNLLLGRVVPAFEIPIIAEAAEQRVQEIRAQMKRESGEAIDRETLLSGFLRIANERMAEAINRISIAQGADPVEYTLVSFGGAGGQHACAIAELLGMTRVLVPQDASLLSAYGLSVAVIERFAERSVLRPLDGAKADVPELLRSLEAEALNAVRSEAGDSAAEVRRRIFGLRLEGQDSVLSVDADNAEDAAEKFRALYESTFAYWPEGKATELESVRVVASTQRPHIPVAPHAAASHEASDPGQTQRAWTGGKWEGVRVYDSAAWTAGAGAAGPALISGGSTSVMLERGWRAEMREGGHLLLELSP